MPTLTYTLSDGTRPTLPPSTLRSRRSTIRRWHAVTSSGDEDTPIAVELTGTDIDAIASVTVTTLPPVGEGVLYYADGTTPVVAKRR